MKFGCTLLIVSDVDKSLKFYESAFDLKRKFYHLEGDQGYGELDTGATTLGFVSHGQAKSEGLDFELPNLAGPAPALLVGIVVGDVQEAYDKAVSKGASPISPPQAKPWGETLAYVRDVDGFLVTLGTGVEN
jgi:uncharacterized glyoxalase superfamily protein PhnB